MNWEAAGALGEIIGAAAVVLSLIYLGSQVRTQNRESRLAAMHEIAEAFRDATRVIATLEFTELAFRAGQEFESLSSAEKVVVFGNFQNLFRVCEEAFIQRSEGRLDERYWLGMQKYLETILGISAVARFWTMSKFLFDEQFTQFVDSLNAREYEF